MFSGSYPKILSDTGKATLLNTQMEIPSGNEEAESDSDDEVRTKKRKKIEIVVDLNDKM